MKELSIGDVTITSIIERDGPWRTPQEMFPAYDPIIGKRHLVELDPRGLRSGVRLWFLLPFRHTSPESNILS